MRQILSEDIILGDYIQKYILKGNLNWFPFDSNLNHTSQIVSIKRQLG